MYKVLMWSAVAVLGSGAALFVPIDPAVIQAVGLGDGSSQPLAGRQFGRQQYTETVPHKFVASGQQSANGVKRRVGYAPAPLPYPVAALPTKPQPADIQPTRPGPTKHITTTARVGQIAIAPAPQLVADAAIAASPVSSEIVRGLQAELRRVGCYNGRVDGDWGPASRFAMASFAKASNATLPAERPDAGLLAVVRRHPGGAYGKAPTPASKLTTAAVVPRAKVRNVSAWQTRVAPLRQRVRRRVQPQPQLVQPPVLVSSGTVAAPINNRRRRIIVADPFAKTDRRANPFASTRMSLGGRPVPAGAQPSLTTPRAAVPQPYGTYQRTQPRFANPQLVQPRLVAPNVAATPPRVRRSSAKRRRYSRRRRGRTRNWRKKVFPGLYN